MYYVEIKGNLIVAKGYIAEKVSLNEDQIEVSEEIYNQIGDYRAEFEQDVQGNIISVRPISPPPEPLPEPTELEELANYVLDVDFRVVMLEMGL